MERDAERGVDWVHLPVIATAARLLCRELELRAGYLRRRRQTRAHHGAPHAQEPQAVTLN